jgi:hypothetical protein
MARTDRQRWLDWRSNGGRSLRPIRTCRACRAEFLPDTVRQSHCLLCIQAEIERQRKERERAELEEAQAAAERAAMKDRERAFQEMRHALSEAPPPPKRMHRNWKGRESPAKKRRRLGALDEAARPRRDT